MRTLAPFSASDFRPGPAVQSPLSRPSACRSLPKNAGTSPFATALDLLLPTGWLSGLEARGDSMQRRQIHLDRTHKCNDLSLNPNMKPSAIRFAASCKVKWVRMYSDGGSRAAATGKYSVKPVKSGCC